MRESPYRVPCFPIPVNTMYILTFFRPRRFAGAVAGLLVLLLAAPTLTHQLEAQTRSLEWTETRSFEMPGTFGNLLRAFSDGDGDRETRQALHLQGAALIQTEGDQAYLMDLDTSRWLFIDHGNQSYMEMSFEEALQMADEMNEMMAGARTEADQAMAEAQAEADQSMEEMQQAMEDAQAELSFTIDIEESGETRTAEDGSLLSQYFVEARVEATAAPEGMDEPEGGAMVFLVELWQSDDIPEAEALYEAWAQQVADNPALREMVDDMAQSAESGTEAMAPVFAMWDARIAAGLEEIAEAMQDVEGTTVRSTTMVALVPDEVEYTREELLAWEPDSMGDRLRTQASEQARASIQDAARNAIRGRLGRFGGGGDDDDDAEEADPPQVRPMLRMTFSKEDVEYTESSADVLGELMARIESYQRLDLAALMQQADPGN